MKNALLHSLLALCFIGAAGAEPGKIDEFDADQRSIEEMLKAVREQVAAGEDKVVQFPSGQFKLFPAGEDEEDRGAKLVTGEIGVKLDDAGSLKKVEAWILDKKPGWVHLRMDVDLASKHFFELEKLLSAKKVSYIVSTMDYEVEGGLHLMVVPGPPTLPKVE